MKVIFVNAVPFYLAHGGTQTLVEAIMREVAALGVQVEPERWWDDTQTGDIIHYINRPTTLHLQLARQKGYKLIMTESLDQTASRSRPKLFAQRTFIKAASRLLPKPFTTRMGWDAYQELDAMVYITPLEWDTAKFLFNANPARGHIIPHGLPPETLEELAKPAPESDYLISAATIHPRKNSVLLARAARQAQTPIVFLGKPYSEDDPYFQEFKSLVDGKIVRYPGFVSTEEKFRYLRSARGFALLSQFESGCISVFEAAAAGLPLFLSDLPWATTPYDKARSLAFTKVSQTPEQIAVDLRRFYDKAHRSQGTTFPVLTWREVASKYVEIYKQILGS